MIRSALVIAVKDVRLLACRGTSLVQAMLLGLTLVVLCSLALEGRGVDGMVAATMFWLASLFSLVLVFNALFALEEADGGRAGLMLAPMPQQAIWLGKALAGMTLLVLMQMGLAVATVIFLDQSWTADPLTALLVVLLVDAGASALAALFGPLVRGGGMKESLSPVLLFPLLMPLFLVGIRVHAVLFNLAASATDRAGVDFGNWLGLAAAFDAVFVAAALILFPFIFGGDD